jgi:hypothetical protein
MGMNYNSKSKIMKEINEILVYENPNLRHKINSRNCDNSPP